ncbi:MAG: inosine/xanthosine triphosphatase [Candidatus Gottesmanbacteria bacterium]
MLKIIIASTNPVKISAVQQGFSLMFPQEKFNIKDVAAKSGVGKQPMTNWQTISGALNRVNYISQVEPKADYWVGIEGGVEEIKGEMEVFAWVVIKDKSGRVSKGKTGTFTLPQKVVKLVKQGMELGEADDIVFSQKNSKQKTGAVGLLTGNVIDRTKYYIEAVILALIPFRNKNLYS